jgi:hypothetical protein
LHPSGNQHLTSLQKTEAYWFLCFIDSIHCVKLPRLTSHLRHRSRTSVIKLPALGYPPRVETKKPPAAFSAMRHSQLKNNQFCDLYFSHFPHPVNSFFSNFLSRCCSPLRPLTLSFEGAVKI